VFQASIKLLKEREVGRASGVSNIAMLSLNAETITK
jgi:hypothetical protein